LYLVFECDKSIQFIIHWIEWFCTWYL